MPLHLGIPHGHTQEQTREARRILQERVRNDWSYPSAPHPDTHSPATANDMPNAKAAVTAQVATDPAPSSLPFEPLEWRAREYSENETSSDEDEGPTTIKAQRAKRKLAAAAPPATEQDITERKLARKRKRQERFEEEMSWNIGLAHFSAQRNAWTCAQSGRDDHVNNNVNNHVKEMDTEMRDETIPETTQEDTDHVMDTDTTPHARQDISRQLAITEDATVRLPIPPKLLPDHPIRSRITPSTYSEIYSKIILQARTPTIPINLQDITNALIHGWKEEGNWPPKPSAPEPSMQAGSKKKKDAADGVKHPHLIKGVHAVTKVFHGLTGGPLDGGAGGGVAGRR